MTSDHCFQCNAVAAALCGILCSNFIIGTIDVKMKMIPYLNALLKPFHNSNHFDTLDGQALGYDASEFGFVMSACCGR